MVTVPWFDTRRSLSLIQVILLSRTTDHLGALLDLAAAEIRVLASSGSESENTLKGSTILPPIRIAMAR